MKIDKTIFLQSVLGEGNYLSPSIVVYEVFSEGILCGSMTENLGEDEGEW